MNYDELPFTHYLNEYTFGHSMEEAKAHRRCEVEDRILEAEEEIEEWRSILGGLQ